MGYKCALHTKNSLVGHTWSIETSEDEYIVLSTSQRIGFKSSHGCFMCSVACFSKKLSILTDKNHPSNFNES